VHVLVVLLPVLPWPLVAVVVVWLFVLLPTFAVLVHETVPFSLVNVPPLLVHCSSEGEAASATVGPRAISDTEANISAQNKRGMAFLLRL